MTDAEEPRGVEPDANQHHRQLVRGQRRAHQRDADRHGDPPVEAGQRGIRVLVAAAPDRLLGERQVGRPPHPQGEPCLAVGDLDPGRPPRVDAVARLQRLAKRREIRGTSGSRAQHPAYRPVGARRDIDDFVGRHQCPRVAEERWRNDGTGPDHREAFCRQPAHRVCPRRVRIKDHDRRAERTKPSGEPIVGPVRQQDEDSRVASFECGSHHALGDRQPGQRRERGDRHTLFMR